MTADNRRAFLKRLAQGLAYSAPVIASFSAPPELVGQGGASQHKPMASAAPTTTTTTTDPSISGPPPWEEPPPGQQSGGGRRPDEPFRE